LASLTQRAAIVHTQGRIVTVSSAEKEEKEIILQREEGSQRGALVTTMYNVARNK
jgi:hypothetical protein